MELTHLSLFSGIGGIDLAAEWAGFETVCFVEIDKFCQKVLRKHWPDVPIVEDIRDVRGEQFKQPITLITGGFPCQPVSVAGKRRGKEDDRWLWPEMLRVIREVRPTWVVAENVAGLIRMGLNDCLADLEGEGFEVAPFLIPACAVNAPHRRDRVFIVAHDGLLQSVELPRGKQKRRNGLNDGCEDVADTSILGLQRGRHESNRLCQTSEIKAQIHRTSWNQWATEPDVGRVAHGVPSRVDRLRALGNAVVPAQIYPILKAIAEIEMSQEIRRVEG